MRHRWTEPSKLAPSDDTGFASNVRTCVRCGMQKITCLPPHGWPWHEFISVSGEQWLQERTPPCNPEQAA